METRCGPALRSAPRHLRLAAACGALALAVLGCGSAPPSSAPSETALRPAIQIDQQWTVENGQWTFTGQIDPGDDPADVVLEIGPAPATLRRFDTRVPVETGRTTAGSVSVTTTEIPDITDICVRFTATNSAGTSSSSPFCFPHDLPTRPPAGAPTVAIDPGWTFADGGWTFAARVDPKGSPTDVVLELGVGPAAVATFDSTTPVAQDVSEASKLEFTTKDVPDGAEICVRFTATNAIGSATSEALCVPSDGSSPSPGPS